MRINFEKGTVSTLEKHLEVEKGLCHISFLTLLQTFSGLLKGSIHIYTNKEGFYSKKGA